MVVQMVFGNLWKLAVFPVSSLYKVFASLRVSRSLVTMKLDSSQFQALFTPELTELASIFKKNDFELRIAGGAVRDILMGKHPADIDLATIATPEQMKSVFEKEGIRMLNTNGERHGTVTVRLNEKVNFEVTTLRIDVVTDGRHADVAFTTEWHLDAGRRDLTINAMFLGLDGTVYDYFNGIEDLKKKRVAFVGNTVERIQEDYLRILRYFRFYGRIAEEPDNHEASTLDAIKANVVGLDRISGERLMIELQKILSGRFYEELMLKLIELGIPIHIGLPSKLNLEEFKTVCRHPLKMNPITLITALLENENEVLAFHNRMRMSNFERELCLFIIKHRGSSQPDLKFLKSLLFTNYFKISDINKWICELLKYKGNQQLLEEFEAWEMPKFPVKGNELLEKGIVKGPKLSYVLNMMKRNWCESDFQKSQEDLLNYAVELMSREDFETEYELSIKRRWKTDNTQKSNKKGKTDSRENSKKLKTKYT